MFCGGYTRFLFACVDVICGFDAFSIILVVGDAFWFVLVVWLMLLLPAFFRDFTSLFRLLGIYLVVQRFLPWVMLVLHGDFGTFSFVKAEGTLTLFCYTSFPC